MVLWAFKNPSQAILERIAEILENRCIELPCDAPYRRGVRLLNICHTRSIPCARSSDAPADRRITYYALIAFDTLEQYNFVCRLELK